MQSSPPGVPNDVLLLEARLRQGRAETHPHTPDGEYFLISSIDTILRSRALSYQQIEDGIVEGGNDGGIDAVYTFYNGNLLDDASEAGYADRPQIVLEIIQAKGERGFKEVALQRLIDHIPLLLQLDENPGLATEFNERLLDRFGVFRSLMINAGNSFPELSICVRYATKAVDPPNEKAKAKSGRLINLIRRSFPTALVGVDFVGAAELNSRARERLSSVLELRVSEGPISAEKGGLVCLVALADYNKFIKDAGGRLREEIFEENVRGYEGATVINRAILTSLRQGDSSTIDFWWLNNGITILTARLHPSGKRLVLEDPQIVNGLQTSRSVFQYFSTLPPRDGNGAEEGQTRHLLVRVIETSEERVSGQVIKATNSQNRISMASLRATEPFQRDVEEFFARNGMYYERKKNQYKIEQKPRELIVEVLELAQAVAAIVLRRPHTARGRPSALVRDKLYTSIFNRKVPLQAYLNCIRIMKQVDEFLAGDRHRLTRAQRSNLRYHLARVAVAFALSSSRPSFIRVSQLDVDLFNERRLEPVLEWLLAAREAAIKSTKTDDLNVIAKGLDWTNEIDRRLRRYSDKMRWPKRLSGIW